MTESTPQASTPGSNSSVPNAGMYMGQFPWPQPAYIPGYAPPPNYPYGMPPDGTHGAAPQYAPVAPSAGVGAGVAHHAFQPAQHGYYPPAVAGVPGATNVGPDQPLTAAAPPPQYPPAPPLYHQPFPSNSVPGAPNPYAPPIPHQGYLQQPHGPGLAMGSASSVLPQVPNFPVAKKRVAKDLEERDAKRTKVGSSKMKDDPLFKPVLNRCGLPNGTFMCSKDGMVLYPESYRKHVRTKKHLGFKLERFECPSCMRTFTRRDTCKRHWDDGCGKLAPEGARLSHTAACQVSTAPVAPVAAPTPAFTICYPYPMPVASVSQNMQVAPPAACVEQLHGMPNVANPVCLSQSPKNDTVAEPAEDGDDNGDDADFWEANEI